jgi:hypothetical protein
MKMANTKHCFAFGYSQRNGLADGTPWVPFDPAGQEEERTYILS